MAQSIYKPLDPISNQIRLLRLESTIYESVTSLQGTLDVVSLDENPEYVAISYEWSPSMLVNQSAIRAVINGHELYVTPNMARALLCTQDGPPTSTRISGPTRFWIDALCINQKDDNERGHQVSMMRQIYQQASAVSAWLGEAGDNSDLAMDLLLEFGGYLDVTHAIQRVVPMLLNKWNEETPTTLNRDQTRVWIQTKWHNWLRSLSARLVDERAAEWVNERLEHPAYSDRWAALAGLCSRSYWSRSWIIQELATSSINFLRPFTRIYCGARYTDLYSLFILSIHIGSLPFFDLVYSETTLVLARAIKRVSWVAKVWSLFRLGRADLLNLLGGSGEFESSEPRDKVYSLLGLTKPYIESRLNADYTIPTCEVLRRTAVHIILGSRNLYILLFCAKNGERMPGLPSWVPDWTSFKPNSLPQIYPNLGKPWSVGSSSYQSVEILKNSMVLKVKARLLGHIHGVAYGEDIPLIKGDELESEARIAARLNAWIDLALTDLHLSRPHVLPDDKNLSTVVGAFHFLYYAMFQILDSKGKGMKEWPFEAFVNWVLSTRSREPELSSLHLTWEQIAHFVCYLGPDRCLFKYNGFSNLPNLECLQALGICWRGVNPGDTLVVVQGCPYPLVIRSVGSCGDYELISDAIVDGFMNEEALGIAPEVEITLN